MALDNITKAGQLSRGIYQRVLPENPSKDYYYILRETGNVEPILVEYGFIDNRKDANKLVNNITDYAEGVVKAIADYVGVTYVPPGGEEPTEGYKVKKGDTLYAIAKKFNISVNELKALNNLTSNELYIGQVLDVTPIQSNVYVVKRGDTLYSIARMNSVSVKDLKEVNNLTSDVLYIGQELLIPSEIKEEPDDEPEIEEPDINDNDNIDTGNEIYVVKKGDSLWSISRKYNVTVQDIQALNNLEDNTLIVGQELYIPLSVKETYIVERGDTLWSISKKFNVSVQNLKDENNLKDNTLSIGQQLIIP